MYKKIYRTGQILRQSRLEWHFVKKSTFCAKFLITTVIFGSNLNATAPNTSGRKLERRRSICVNTVFEVFKKLLD